MSPDEQMETPKALTPRDAVASLSTALAIAVAGLILWYGGVIGGATITETPASCTPAPTAAPTIYAAIH